MNIYSFVTVALALIVSLASLGQALYLPDEATLWHRSWGGAQVAFERLWKLLQLHPSSTPGASDWVLHF